MSTPVEFSRLAFCELIRNKVISEKIITDYLICNKTLCFYHNSTNCVAHERDNGIIEKIFHLQYFSL